MPSLHHKIRKVLSDFWDKNVLDVPEEAADGDAEIDIDAPLVQLDSLTAVHVLLDIEAIIGKQLKIDEIVRKGGYSTKEQFIEEVTKAVEEFLGKAL